MSIIITDEAAIQIKSAILKRGSGMGVRVKVVNSGCTGKAYSLEYVDVYQEGDELVEHMGASVFLDPDSVKFMQGAIMDWRKEGLNSGFKFDNPNVLLECGCGKSFSA